MSTRIDEAIPGTTLRIKELVYHHVVQQHHGEGGEITNVYSVIDEKTGETGFFRHQYAWYKRAVSNEVFNTSNAELFRNNYPEADWYCSTPTLSECFEIGDDFGEEPNCPEKLNYTEKDGQWGIRCIH